MIKAKSGQYLRSSRALFLNSCRKTTDKTLTVNKSLGGTRNAGLGTSQKRNSQVASFHTRSRKSQKQEINASNTGDVVSSIEKTIEAAKVTKYETMNTWDFQAPHTGVIKVISFNRAKARNAISRQFLKDLSEQIEAIHAEPPSGPTRALILASELDESFCAGADLKERKNMTQDETSRFLTSLRHTFKRVDDLPVPSISCVSGTALGGGLELALCTHLRVFSTNAVVGLPETRLGIIPGAGGTYRLPRVIGLNQARHLILTGRRVDAEQAANVGLCNYLTAVEGESSTLDPKSKRLLALAGGIQLAIEISEGGPIALRAAIQSLKDGGGEKSEDEAYKTVLETEDRVEALKAFGEKRSPQFKGR